MGRFGGRAGGSPTDFGYTAQRQEAGFGLYDYNARFYSPILGRFISADSIVPDPTDTNSLNRYGYANNNPIRYKDPSGHCVWDLCIVEGAIIGAGIALAVDYAAQVNNNLNSGMSFGEAVYYENINTQELGGWMLGGTIGGGVTAVAAPAVAPYAYNLADKATQILQNPIGRGAVEGGMQSCSENCSPENVIAGAGQGAALGAIVEQAARGYASQFDSSVSAASAIYDARTGKFYYGTSGQPYPSEIHPDLQDTFSSVPGASHGKPPINCAECQAYNQALLDGANPADLNVYTLRPRTGEALPRCDNCRVTLPDNKGITVWSDQ